MRHETGETGIWGNWYLPLQHRCSHACSDIMVEIVKIEQKKERHEQRSIYRENIEKALDEKRLTIVDDRMPLALWVRV